MKNKLQPFQKELLQKTEEILHTDWNPLGGDDVPRGEYDSYALQVFGMIQSQYTIDIQELKMFYNDPAFSKIERKKEQKESMSDFLYKIETEDMGLDGDRVNCKKVEEEIERLFREYSFQMKLDLMEKHLDELIKNQKEQIKKKNPDFSWLN